MKKYHTKNEKIVQLKKDSLRKKILKIIFSELLIYLVHLLKLMQTERKTKLVFTVFQSLWKRSLKIRKLQKRIIPQSGWILDSLVFLFEAFFLESRKMSSLKIDETKCVRCNKGFASVSEVIEIDGQNYGPECAKRVFSLQKALGLSGDDLIIATRKEYRDEMRVKTVEGMIRKGMFPGIKCYDEFLEDKAKNHDKKKQLQEQRKALLEQMRALK